MEGANDDAEAAAESVIDDSAEGWDQRYDGADRIWSGEPNGALVAEVKGLEPGTALDLGCGEGADAIWLARHGWEVTAVDISQIAVDRGHRAADEAGVAVQWVVADVVDMLTASTYDLVSAQYPAFRKDADGRALHAIVDAVAPGGTLVVVHHDVETMLAQHDHHDWDPTEYVLPVDVAAVLGDGWTIEVDEVRTRVRPAGSPGPDVPDVVLRARRT